MDININQTSDEEEKVLYKAVLDIQSKGETDILCPRCNKKLQYNGNHSGYCISCEDDKCIKLTIRGI